MVDNEILNDCKWYADKHRGKNVKSGPHWSTIIRFPILFDEAVRLRERVDTLEKCISDYCSPEADDGAGAGGANDYTQRRRLQNNRAVLHAL